MNSYTVVMPRPAKLIAGESAVQLDTGDFVAVRVVGSVAAHSGAPVVTAYARVINPDGSDKLDSNGHTIESSFPYTTSHDEIALLTIEVVRKCVIMAVLGQPTDPMLRAPEAAQVLSDVSIRTKLASLAHAGIVDTSSLL